MRYFCAFLLCLIASSVAFGQDTRADVFAGYSYLNIDTNGLSSRQSANGWEASVSGNFNKWFAVEGEVSGYYKSYSVDLSALSLGTQTVKVTDYSYAAGPRINFKPIFVHALLGGDHLTGSALGFSASQDGLAGLAGGGVQWRVSGPWSVRASADYVFTRHNIFGGPSVTQNNYRASVGIVYSFGRTEQPTAVPRAGAGMSIPALGIGAVAGDSQGATIVSEEPTSVAALAGFREGDVINSVDGKPVKSPAELAAALSELTSGAKVRLGRMIHGEWQTETVIILP